jgi:imidazolonepropionase-like amidohydrolase
MRLFICFLFLTKLFFSQNLILKNVTVIPINHEVTIADCNVYIKNGRIEKIENSLSKQFMKGYKIIDCKGKFLVPGLADMHAHFPGKDSPIKLKDYLKLNLAAGVTTLRSMRGEHKQLALRDSIAKGLKINSPEMYVSFVFPESDSLLKKESIEKMVVDAKNNKYDFIKYLGGINETNFNYLVESCQRNDFPIEGHAYNRSLEKSIAAGFASVEHYQPLLAAYTKDSANLKNTLLNMKTKGVSFCPTLSFYHVFAFEYPEKTLLERNGMKYVSAKVKSAWLKEYNEALKTTKEKLNTDFESKYTDVYQQQFLKFDRIFKMAVNAGVNVLLSPDDGIFNVPGFSMYEEMMLYKKAGFTNYQILKCATYNAAVHVKQQKNLGSVEVGRKANLLLLNANPLENIENIKQVEATLLNGKYYSQAELLK